MMKTRKPFFRILLLAPVLALAGCATSPTAFSNAPVYKTGAMHSPIQDIFVTIESVSLVQIERQSNGTLQVVGGTIGAIAGSTMGSGKGNQATTILGGVAGTLAGDAIDKARSKTPGYNISFTYFSRTDQRQVYASVVQAADNVLELLAPGWRPGMPFPKVQARLQQSNGSMRISPL